MKVYYTPRDGFACTMDTFSQIGAEKIVSLSTIVLKRKTSVSMVGVCYQRVYYRKKMSRHWLVFAVKTS